MWKLLQVETKSIHTQLHPPGPNLVCELLGHPRVVAWTAGRVECRPDRRVDRSWISLEMEEASILHVHWMRPSWRHHA